MSEDNGIKVEPGITLYLTSGVFYWSVGDPGDPDYMSGASETLEGARKARSQYTTEEWGQAESQQRRIDAGLAKGLALPTLVWGSESEEPPH